MEETLQIKIAIADDHLIVRKGICEIILGFEKFTIVFEANNGVEMLEKLTTITDLPEIVILDVSMPKLDGYDTLIAIKKKWPFIKVLILTMFNNEFSIIKMIRNGANGYLLKNSDPKELEKALLAIHTENFYSSVTVSNRLYKLIHDSDILPQISEIEKRFLSHVGTDLTYEEIAKKMHLPIRSILGHKDTLCEKLEVTSRPELVVWAIKLGFIPID